MQLFLQIIDPLVVEFVRAEYGGKPIEIKGTARFQLNKAYDDFYQAKGKTRKTP